MSRWLKKTCATCEHFMPDWVCTEQRAMATKYFETIEHVAIVPKEHGGRTAPLKTFPAFGCNLHQPRKENR